MNILTVIPARSGSKRVPGKNIKILHDKPLLAWTIETALAADVSTVMVSTDDREIADIAEQYGASVPFLRSDKYSSDISDPVDAVLEVLSEYEKRNEYFDAVLLLQPTSPFRTKETIKRAIDLYESGGGESVISVSSAKTHPAWCKVIDHGTIRPYINTNDDQYKRSQDLKDVFQLNGVIYLASKATLLSRHQFYSENTIALIIESEEECIDIDTYFDWYVATAIAENIYRP